MTSTSLSQMESPEIQLRLSVQNLDRRGLIWGYELTSATPIGLDHPAGASPVWLHFNLTDGRARAWLSEQAELPSAALSMLCDLQARTQVQRVQGGVVGILQDLHHDFKGDPEGFGELRFYFDAQRVISARRHPLKAIDVVRRALEQGARIPSTAIWLEQLVSALANSFGNVVHELVDRVDELEDQIVAGHGSDHRATLANIRRLLVRFRRHLHADRTALGRLRSAHEGGELALTPLRQALEHLDGVAQDLDLVHERVRLLQEEVAGLLAEATNRNLYVLSVVTTVLLPTTVITGIWGMNVGGLPWSEDSHGFFWTALTLFGSVLFSLALLRRSRVL